MYISKIFYQSNRNEWTYQYVCDNAFDYIWNNEDLDLLVIFFIITLYKSNAPNQYDSFSQIKTTLLTTVLFSITKKSI